jgi:hypothetical protein
MNNLLSYPGRTWFRLCLLAGFALFLAGCVSQSGSDGKQTFSYSPLLTIGIILGGVLAIPIGFFWRKSDGRLGWGLMIIVPIAAVLMAGTMGFEQVNVSDQQVEVRSGFFGSTAALTVPFDQVKQIRITQESTGGRRARMIDVFYFQSETGELGRFPLNNDVKIEASKAILDRAAKRGIVVVGQ